VSEAVTWSHLRHENIVSFIGVMEKDHSLWLVSKWMFSGNVRAFLDIAGRAKSDLRHLVSCLPRYQLYLLIGGPLFRQKGLQMVFVICTLSIRLLFMVI
jgi:hypothetical protein